MNPILARVHHLSKPAVRLITRSFAALSPRAMAALTHQPKSTKMLSGRYYSTADFVAALQKELQDSKGEDGTIPVTPKGFALTDKEG